MHAGRPGANARRSKAHELAAFFFGVMILAIVPGISMPECEAQVRPLVGLPAELAQQAWLEALSWSRDGHVPARLVKRAVKQVLKIGQPAVAKEADANRQRRRRVRQSGRTGFQELLTLLLGSAEREVLIAKVQEIQRLLEPILSPKKNQSVTFCLASVSR